MILRASSFYVRLKDAGSRRWINCTDNSNICDTYKYESCLLDTDWNGNFVHVCQNGHRKRLNGCIHPEDCTKGDFCDFATAQCYPPVEQGDPCLPNATQPCHADLFCHPQLQRCVSWAVSYPKCAQDVDCPVFEYCSSHTCVKRLALNELCSYDTTQCALGLACYEDPLMHQGPRCRRVCRNHQDCAPKGHCYNADLSSSLGVCMGSTPPVYQGSEPANLFYRPWFIVTFILSIFLLINITIFFIWRMRRRRQQQERAIQDKLTQSVAFSTLGSVLPQ